MARPKYIYARTRFLCEDKPCTNFNCTRFHANNTLIQFRAGGLSGTNSANDLPLRSRMWTVGQQIGTIPACQRVDCSNNLTCGLSIQPENTIYDTPRALPNAGLIQNVSSTSHGTSNQHNSLLPVRSTNLPMSLDLNRQFESKPTTSITRIPNPWEIGFANRTGNYFPRGPCPSPLPRRYRSTNVVSDPIVRVDSPENVGCFRSRSAQSTMRVSPKVRTTNIESDYVSMDAIHNERTNSGIYVKNNYEILIFHVFYLIFM